MNHFTIKNWSKYQHYKDRNPPWIKLHNSLLEDYEFDCLPDDSKLHLILIWMLASKLGGVKPQIPCDEKWIQKKINLENSINLKPLFEKGFLILDSKMLAERLQDASLEEETERETETDKQIVRKKDFAPLRLNFETIWENYPCKKGKENAWLKFKNQVITAQDWDDIQEALQNYIGDVKYIQKTSHPERDYQNGSTWFNNNWKDYINLKPNSTDLSYLEQAQLSRGYFVDKVLINIEEVLKRPNTFKTREAAAMAYIDSVAEEEKEPTKMILYNFAYIE